MRKILAIIVLGVLMAPLSLRAANQQQQKQLTINVVSGLSITTTSLPSGVAGAVYPTTTLQATGGVPPYIWTVLPPGAGETGLPSGLSLSLAGVLSGTISSSACSGTQTCPFKFTVQVTDNSGQIGLMHVDTSAPTVAKGDKYCGGERFVSWSADCNQWTIAKPKQSGE